MEFRIADTFTDSLARLTSDEQKAVKTTAFDLQLNPASPGMSFHKCEKAKDRNFWSVRVSSAIRMIVHKTAESILLCYVDHHDKAYHWAEKRRLETHPTTGAAQLVEIRETVQEIFVPVYEETPMAPAAAPLLFAAISDEELRGYGVPEEWLADVRGATEDTLLTLTDHLPAEAAEALLELATGGKPRVTPPAEVPANPFEHPDALRRFRLMNDFDELERALDYPWEKWMVFLHPDQRQWVTRKQSGAARVSGSAGTGKTVVALHRAVHLARAHPDARVLLTTFSKTLANDLRSRLHKLVSNEPTLAERIDVYPINEIGTRLYKVRFGLPQIAFPEEVRSLLKQALDESGSHAFTPQFVTAEWEQIVDAWHLESWEAYRDVPRLGRKTRIPEQQRAVLWSIFARLRDDLAAQNLTTYSAMFHRLATAMNEAKNPPFDFCVVDEAQDISVWHLRFFAALGGGRPNGLFFAGDLGQRIFQQPFSWKALGVDIRGRSRTLRVNYRTSHQIRTQADRLLDREVSDVDGNTEERGNTISVFNGPPPLVQIAANEAEETQAVSAWIMGHLTGGLSPEEIAIFVRSESEIGRAEAVTEQVGVPCKILSDTVEREAGCLSIATMHHAKGLEFKSVAVMACDEEIIPLQERVESVGDSADLQEVYDTERHLLYVACTRARDYLLITGVAPASEFLDDLSVNTRIS